MDTWSAAWQRTLSAVLDTCIFTYTLFLTRRLPLCVCVCVKHCRLKWLICRHIKTIHAQENSFWKAVQCSDHYAWKRHKRDCIFLSSRIYRISSFFNTMCLCLGGTYLGGSFWLIQSFTEHSCFLMICSHQTWSSVLSPVAPLWSPLPTLLICLHGTLFVSLSVFGWHTFNFICLPSLVQPVLFYIYPFVSCFGSLVSFTHRSFPETD